MVVAVHHKRVEMVVMVGMVVVVVQMAVEEQGVVPIPLERAKVPLFKTHKDTVIPLQVVYI